MFIESCIMKLTKKIDVVTISEFLLKSPVNHITLENYRYKSIRNPVNHLRWSFLQK